MYCTYDDNQFKHGAYWKAPVLLSNSMTHVPHGGDLENRVAKAEFREIKDTVLADVGGFLQDCIFERDIKPLM